MSDENDPLLGVGAYGSVYACHVACNTLFNCISSLFTSHHQQDNGQVHQHNNGPVPATDTLTTERPSAGS